MWRIIEFIVIAAILLIAITEFFYPILAGKPLFGSFRKVAENGEKTEDQSLEDKLNNAKEKLEEIKTVQNEVDKNYKSAEQLKDEADNLLNNKK
jgi:membrane-associated HD superfamily phosphohydrolase